MDNGQTCNTLHFTVYFPFYYKVPYYANLEFPHVTPWDVLENLGNLVLITGKSLI